MSLNLSIRKMPSPPFPEFGLQMKVNFGCSYMYDCKEWVSSGSWKLIGENPNYFSKVLRILFVIRQNTFLRAKYSRQGYLFQ